MELMTLISWLSDFVGWDDGSGDFVGWDDGSVILLVELMVMVILLVDMMVPSGHKTFWVPTRNIILVDIRDLRIRVIRYIW